VRPSTAISIRKRGTGSYIPPALQECILHRHFIGQSMPTISREEHRDFGTVAEVLRNNPARLREHLEGGRAAFYALTTGALETIRRAMENGDAEMAYRLLTDCGEVPQPGQIPGVMESENFETPEPATRKSTWLNWWNWPSSGARRVWFAERSGRIGSEEFPHRSRRYAFVENKISRNVEKD